jgi:hypothetical protein
MIKIILDGRKDVNDYFKISGVFESERLNHTPLLALIASEDTVTVRIIDKPVELLDLTDETPVMGQWKGQWHSDFFQFTVGQYREYVESQYEPLKSARNVIKVLGPKGGFRSLSYEYVNEHGAVAHASTGFKDKAERLEKFFVSKDIPITIIQETH